MTILKTPAGLSYLDFQNNSIAYGLQRYKVLVADEPGLGKGHPLTSRVLTPEGYTEIGSLELGDKVIGSQGTPVTVSGIYDRGLLSVYRVTTSDGASTVVDGDHLWTVLDEDTLEPVTIGTMQIKEMLDRGEEPMLPIVTNAVEFTPKKFKIDPFTAGLNVMPRNRLADPLPKGFDFSIYETGSIGQRVDFLSAVIRSFGKVRGDEDDCIALFPKVKEVSRETIDTICQITRSLGGLAFVYLKNYTWYRVELYLPDSVTLSLFGYAKPRKRINRRWKRYVQNLPLRTITSITPIGKDYVRCIEVNSPDNLYLTDQYIVTHNTVSAVGISNNIDTVRSMLVVCLASHKIHWARAIEKWDMHELSIGICNAGDPFPDTECVVINYDILHRYYDEIRAGTWDIMICDEAHVLQNEESRRTLNVFGGKLRVPVGEEPDDVDDSGQLVKTKKKKGVKKVWRKWQPIKANREVYLTGTPIPNRVKHMWPIIKRCDPYGLGRNREAFTDRYCGAYETFHGRWEDGASNLPELNRILKDRFMVRHLKAEVLKDLPPKIRQVIPLSSEGLQKKLQAEKDAVAALLAAYEAKMGIHVDMDVETLASLVMRARPSMFDDYAETVNGDSLSETPLNKLAIARAELALAKVPMAIEYITNLINQGLKVVVFAYHRDVIHALRDRWSNSCALIYGGTPTHKRQAEADRFVNDPNCNPFIGQYTAAGTGYTLTVAHHVVCVEMTWLPYELTQAEDRCHRISQVDTVWVHHLIVEGSMDEGMLAKIVEKQRVIDEALN